MVLTNIRELRNNSSEAEIQAHLNRPRIPSSIYTRPWNPDGIDSVVRVMNTITPISVPTDRGKYYTSFGVSQYSRDSLLGINASNSVEQFILPLPTTLADTHSVVYDDGMEIGKLWGNALQAIGSALSGQNSQGSLGENVLVGTVGTLPNISDYAGLFAGYMPNEFLTVLLRGPNYKQFKMDFVISPKSSQESENLRLILRKFNNFMAPGISPRGSIFEFPLIFNICFSPNPKYLFRFKPSVLENIQINYAGSGHPTFYKEREKSGSYTGDQNAPETVAFTLNFLEMEYWLTGDFKDTNTVGTSSGLSRGSRGETWEG